MNSRIAVYAIVITLAFVAGAFVIPPIVDSFAPTPTGMSVMLLDADGNEVYSDSTKDGPFFPFGVQDTAGHDIVSASVTVTYTITSDVSDASITAISVSGAIYAMEASAKYPWSVARTTITHDLALSTQQSGTYSYTQTLADLLPDEGSTSSIEYGWLVRFQCDLTVTATVNGVAQTGSWSGYVQMQLYWSESTAGIGVDATISFD